MTPIRDPVTYMEGVWDWSILRGCFGSTRISPTDIDGFVERNGRFLVIEAKKPDADLTQGQRIAFEALQQTGLFWIVIVWGEKDKPERMELWTCIGKMPFDRADLKMLRTIANLWYAWANAPKLQTKETDQMEDTKSLVPTQPQQLTPTVWNMIQAVAPAMHAARWFGVLNPEQAAAIMLKGYELGLGLAASFEYIKPIQGRPALVPQGALALIHGKGVLSKLEVKDLADDKGIPTACQVTMRRADTGFEYSVTFSMDDARRAGLVKPDSGWDKYPANMLRWRAIGFCADVVCPDVLGGMKRADELGADLTPTGEIIEGAWQVASESEPPDQPAAQIEDEATALTLDDLLAQYSPEAIMAANEGKIPATLDEVVKVAEVLANGS